MLVRVHPGVPIYKNEYLWIGFILVSTTNIKFTKTHTAKIMLDNTFYWLFYYCVLLLII